MARIYTEGFELGTPRFDFSYNQYATNPSNPYSPARSGTFGIHGEWDGYGEVDISGETDIYLRCALFASNSAGYQKFLSFHNPSGGEIVSFWFNKNGLLDVRYLGASQSVNNNTRQLKVTQWYLLEAHVQISGSVGSEMLEVEFRIDGGGIASITPIDVSSAVPILDTVRWTHSGYRLIFDDIAVNSGSGGVDNSWPGDGRILALRPNDNGDSSDFDGSDGNSTDNYLLVDEAQPDYSATYVESLTPGDTDLYEVQDVTLSQGDVVKRVWVAANAIETSADGDTMQLGVKPNGASSPTWSTTDPLTALSYAQYKSEDHTVNPHTSAAWTETDLDDLQIGIKVP